MVSEKFLRQKFIVFKEKGRVIADNKESSDKFSNFFSKVVNNLKTGQRHGFKHHLLLEKKSDIADAVLSDIVKYSNQLTILNIKNFQFHLSQIEVFDERKAMRL